MVSLFVTAMLESGGAVTNPVTVFAATFPLAPASTA
jgi:hypothetical protein